MADAYGTFVFSRSEAFKCDMTKFLKALNTFNWCHFGGEWVCDTKRKIIFYNCSQSQYPSVMFQTLSRIHCYSKDLGQYYKNANEIVDADWDNLIEEEDRDISLIEIKNLVNPHVKSGWFEISYTSNEKNYYVEFGSLKISKDNESSRRFIRIGQDVDRIDLFEKA